MPVKLRDKIEAMLGITYSCDKCGALFVGEDNANKHENNCE